MRARARAGVCVCVCVHEVVCCLSPSAYRNSRPLKALNSNPLKVHKP